MSWLPVLWILRSSYLIWTMVIWAASQCLICTRLCGRGCSMIDAGNIPVPLFRTSATLSSVFLRRLRHQNFIRLAAMLWSWQSTELFSKCSPAAFVGHEINPHALCQTPNISIWGIIRYSMVKSKIFLFKKPRILWKPEGPQVPLCAWTALLLSITSCSC